jgi:hypothetical protein
MASLKEPEPESLTLVTTKFHALASEETNTKMLNNNPKITFLEMNIRLSLGKESTNRKRLQILHTRIPYKSFLSTFPNIGRNNNQGYAAGFERSKPGEPAYRVCGAYKLTKEYFNVPTIPIPVRGNTEYSLPHTLLSMSDKIKIALVEATFWQPVGTPEELEKAIKIKTSAAE